MRTSCIVVSYQVRDLLAECLRSLRDAEDVIVVDNGHDGSAQMVRERFPHVRVLEQPQNPGFGVAVNLAAAQATGDAFFLLNPDARLAPGQLARIAGQLDDGAAVVGFRQVDEQGRFQLAHGGPPAIGAELLRFAAQKAIDRRMHWVAELVDAAFSERREVHWVAASSMLVRRSAFDDIGGFDSDFFLYFEDIDFCLRLRERGHSVLYDPTLTLVHHRGRSAERASATAAAAYRDSQRLFWRKHRGPVYASLVDAYQRARLGVVR